MPDDKMPVHTCADSIQMLTTDAGAWMPAELAEDNPELGDWLDKAPDGSIIEFIDWWHDEFVPLLQRASGVESEEQGQGDD